MKPPAPSQQQDPAPPIPLAPTESFACFYHRICDGDGDCAVAVRVRGQLEAAPLTAALAALQHRHPKLRASVVELSGERLGWKLDDPPRPIPLTVLDITDAAMPWTGETYRLLQESPDIRTGPLARMLVLRHASQGVCDAVFFGHHVLVDGLSLLGIIHDLFSEYARIQAGEGPRQIDPLPLLSFPKANPVGSWGSRARSLLATVRQRRRRRQGKWTELPPSDGPPAEPQWTRWVLTEKQTLALAMRCRREDTTVYGALFAACLCGISSVLPSGPAHYRCACPIDLRRQLTGPHGSAELPHLGCFISAFDRIYEVDANPSFWPLARHANDALKRFVASGVPSLIYNLFGILPYPKKLTIRKRQTLMISQLGLGAVRDHYGSLDLQECSMVHKNERAGASLNLISVTIQRRLNLTLHGGDLSDSFWASIREEIPRQLEQAVSAGPG